MVRIDTCGVHDHHVLCEVNGLRLPPLLLFHSADESCFATILKVSLCDFTGLVIIYYGETDFLRNVHIGCNLKWCLLSNIIVILDESHAELGLAILLYVLNLVFIVVDLRLHQLVRILNICSVCICFESGCERSTASTLSLVILLCHIQAGTNDTAASYHLLHRHLLALSIVLGCKQLITRLRHEFTYIVPIVKEVR